MTNICTQLNCEETKSIRSAYGNALVEAGKKNSDVVVLDADLACSTQTQIFAKAFPERFFDCGIAEQDMVETAVGLAAVGKIPFVSGFAVFATGRTYDQIRNSVCYPKFNVKIVGTHGGITVGEDGASHQALEDVSLMRGLPNMTVLVPADCEECRQMVLYASNYEGPVYIRVPRTNVADIFTSEYKFNPNKAVVLNEGKDVTIVTNGETVAPCLKAAEELKKDGIEATVINLSVVKPLDNGTILKAAEKTGLVITVENHSVIGGVGSAICELLSENHPIKVHRIGIQDEFGQSGETKALLKYYGLDVQGLYKKFKEILKENK